LAVGLKTRLGFLCETLVVLAAGEYMPGMGTRKADFGVEAPERTQSTVDKGIEASVERA
jgi:hypothetical protein